LAQWSDEGHGQTAISFGLMSNNLTRRSPNEETPLE
jgi:hypothetical protein